MASSPEAVSSRRLRQEFPDPRRHYGGHSRCGLGPTSRGRSVARPSPPCASTSSSKNIPP